MSSEDWIAYRVKLKLLDLEFLSVEDKANDLLKQHPLVYKGWYVSNYKYAYLYTDSHLSKNPKLLKAYLYNLKDAFHRASDEWTESYAVILRELLHAELVHHEVFERPNINAQIHPSTRTRTMETLPD